MKKLKDAKNVPTSLKAGFAHFYIRVFGDVHGLNPRNKGAVTHRTRSIDLDGTSVLGDGAEVLLHEVLHVAYENGGLSTIFDNQAEEKIINILSTQLATMMHDNPDLFRWIIKNVG